MTSIGAVFLPYLPPERLRDVAVAADEAGLDELWLWEDCFREGGLVTAAAALAWTSRVRVGVGLLPVPLRNVALTGMELATLHRLFPDRVRIGVGHGVLDWMAQVGAGVESPMTLLGEYVDALRALLRGERVSTSGRYVKLDGVALDWPPKSAPELLVGAMGPRTLRLSGAHGDGTILVGSTPPEGIREARARIEEGRQRAGRADPHTIVAYLELHGPRDAEAAAEMVRARVAAGAGTVVLEPAPDEPHPEDFVRFVATEVRPLIA